MPNENIRSDINMVKPFINGIQTTLAQYKRTTTSTIKKNLLFIGDSIVEGAGASQGDYNYATMIQKDLSNRQYGDNSTEYIFFPATAIAGSTGLMTLNGTWTNVENENCIVQDGGVDISNVRGFAKTLFDGDSFDIKTYGFLVKVVFASDDAIDDGNTPGTVDIDVDGGTPDVVSLTGSTVYKTVETGATAGSTTVTIEANISGSQSVAIQSIHLYKDFEGLKCVNLGTGGSTSKDWYEHQNIIDAFEPVTTIIQTGANDVIATDVNELQYESNLESIITRCLTHGDAVVTYYAPWNTTNSTVLADIPRYRDVARKICNNHDVKFIDINQVFIDGATANSKDLLSDSIHPNDNGNELIYRYLINELDILT